MSIGRKIELALAAIIVATILALWGWGKYNSERRESVQEDYQVASGDASAYKVMAAGTKRVAEQEQRKHEELEVALEANPEWADEPVPSDVARVLCHSPDAACQSYDQAADHGTEAGAADEWRRGEAGR